MFYYINPNYRYQFFSPQDKPSGPPSEDPSIVEPTEEPKRNLVNALAALYKAYGGKEELNNNAVDIIYKIADVIKPTKDLPPEEVTPPDLPPEEVIRY